LSKWIREATKGKEMEREKDQMKDCGPANVRTLDDIDDIDIYLGLRPHLYLASVANGSVQHRTNPYLPIQTLLQQQSGAWASSNLPH